MPLLIFKNPRFSQRYLLATCFIHLPMIALLFVRASWVALILCLGLLTVLLLRHGSARLLQPLLQKSFLLCCLLVPTVLIVLPSLAHNIVDRFASISKPSGESASEYRLRELNTMISHAVPSELSTAQMQSFFFGHGDFSWTYWAPQLLGESYDRSAVDLAKETGAVLIHPGFCNLLSLLFDNGILGLISYLSFFFILGRLFFRTHLTCNDPHDRSLLYACFLPIPCILICHFFSYDPITPFFWTIIGLSLSSMLIINAHSSQNTDSMNTRT
ncbi:MAG: hypothetical protein HRU15_12460 [Planctomycetes bacterium]|nr:hypothetical protein [Planctomycetota bacterium]